MNDFTKYQRLTIHPSQITGNQVNLTPEQRHYLGRVLRLQTGDEFIAMDGQGHWWFAQFDSPTTARLGEPLLINRELPAPIALLMAIPKGDGMDQVVRQTTELGVRQIFPIVTERTQVHPSPSRIERWQRIATEAAEQSWRQWRPEIFPAQPLTPAWAQVGTRLKLICDPSPGLPYLYTVLPSEPQPLALLIGPEGGWSAGELAWFQAQGGQRVSLGRRVLRTVTAPLAALALVGAKWEQHL
ncbi:MAG: 16S rRNA (uracil(1498)-N(3))-methyltransferase [Gloeomargarita sp. HHBFW_bins_162]